MPVEEMPPIVYVGSRRYSGLDHTYVAPPNLSPVYHSGIQIVIYGSGALGQWNPGGFDPLKKTLYFNFDENMQNLFGRIKDYGENPLATSEREPGDELADKLKERSATEPAKEREEKEVNEPKEDRSPAEFYTPNGVIRVAKDGHVIDTLKIKAVNGRMDYDTIPFKRK